MPVFRWIRRVFISIILIISFFVGCKSQSKDTLYILFEKDKPHMMFMEEKEDDHYAFWVSESLYFGFRPKKKPTVVNSSSFKTEISNYDWLKQKSKFQSDLIFKCPNIFIVEKIGNDSLKLTPVKAFEAIE